MALEQKPQGWNPNISHWRPKIDSKNRVKINNTSNSIMSNLVSGTEKDKDWMKGVLSGLDPSFEAKMPAVQFVNPVEYFDTVGFNTYTPAPFLTPQQSKTDLVFGSYDPKYNTLTTPHHNTIYGKGSGSPKETFIHELVHSNVNNNVWDSAALSNVESKVMSDKNYGRWAVNKASEAPDNFWEMMEYFTKPSEALDYSIVDHYTNMDQPGRDPANSYDRMTTEDTRRAIDNMYIQTAKANRR